MAPPNTNHWTTDPEYIDVLNFLFERTENVKEPTSIRRIAIEFKEKSGAARSMSSIAKIINELRSKIHTFVHLDTNTKVKMLFALSAPVDADFLKKLKEEAFIEVDEKERVIHYKTSDGSLELKGDHSFSAKNRAAQLDAKRGHRRLIRGYFENKNKDDAVPKSREERELWNLIELVTEKCENVNSPLNIIQLARDFNNQFGTSLSENSIRKRLRRYSPRIQEIDLLDTHSKVKQLFGLSATVDSDYLKELRKNAVVEVDEKNRIIKYTENDGSLTLQGAHRGSKKRKPKHVEKKDEENMGTMTDNLKEESDNGGLNDSSDGYSSKEFDSDLNSDEENDPSDETEDHMQPSTFENETPVRSRSSIEMLIDDNFDFDIPAGRSRRSEEVEMGEDDSEITGEAAGKTRKFETLPRSKTSSSTSHTPKSSKRKAGSKVSKRTKRPTENPTNPLQMDDNFLYDDPHRVELKPFRGILGPQNGIETYPDIQQIPKPLPQAMETPIKKEHVEEARTSLKIILNAFKSVILSLDTPGLSHLQMELDKKIMEAERKIEVSNKEVILVMDFLIVKLSKHGALKSSEDSISLRDILLMLRTIILNSSFNGLEVILETLKENIEQLKVLDKRVLVSKVECVLRATLDSICT